MRLNRDMGLKCPENESTELMQKLRFLLNYSSRLGSSWSTTKVSLTAPSRVEQQVDIDVASRRSGRTTACYNHAKHLPGAGLATPAANDALSALPGTNSQTLSRNATCLQTASKTSGTVIPLQNEAKAARTLWIVSASQYLWHQLVATSGESPRGSPDAATSRRHTSLRV